MAQDQEIIDYITQAQKHGLSDFEIKQNLLSAGWDAASVEQGFVFAKAAETSAPQNFGKATEGQILPHASGMGNLIKTPGMAAKPTPVTSVLPSVHSSPSLTEQHFTPVQSSPTQATAAPHSSKKTVWLVLVVVILLALAGGAYAYYVKIYNTPQRVWNGYLKAQRDTVLKADYTVAYNFKVPEASSSDASVGLNGSTYMDLTDPSNPKMSNNLNFNFKYDPMSVSFSVNYLVLNKILYFDVSKIPQIKALFGQDDLTWLKIDYNELAKYAKEQGMALTYEKNPFDLKGQFSPETPEKWASVISSGSFLAKETLNGTGVYHLKPELNKPA